ncbi:MAG TPA: glycosyltransferase family A protein, partial [Anaerolineales bacterium]|nr:glycosyltransferase family A protein [Anaerolineales bacterium]
TLSRAVESVLTQTLPSSDYELIVVNDSGIPLPEADWHRSEQVQVLNTHQRERSVARNTGAAIARGKYLHFLDDDDWVTPDAYQHFLELSRSSDAKWLYGMTQLVDRQDEPSIQLRHNLQGNCFVQVMAGEWIPLQSSLIDRKTFMRIGGFNPLLTGPEDIDLLRRILLEENIDETPNLISQVIMGGEGSTTDYNQHPQASRWARENILESTQAYARMRSSAVNPFWQGRMTRIYLTSIIWNLKHGRFFTAASRMIFSLASMVSSASGIFSKRFWRAVLRPYASRTFENGFREVQNEKPSAN